MLIISFAIKKKQFELTKGAKHFILKCHYIYQFSEIHWLQKFGKWLNLKTSDLN